MFGALHAFYRWKLGSGRGVDAGRAAGPPFTDKEIRTAGQRCCSRDYVACDPTDIVRLHRTSGTTGRGMNLAYTKHDAELAARLGGRAMHAAGLRPGDRVVHCLNYCLWTGGVTDHMILEAAGATVIPFGVGNTAQLIDAIVELGATAIHCTHPYPALIEKTLAAEGKLKPRFGIAARAVRPGEAGLDNPAFRNSSRDLGLRRAQREFRLVGGDVDPGRQPVRAGQRPAFPCRRWCSSSCWTRRRCSGSPIAEGNAGRAGLHPPGQALPPLIRYRTGTW
jgi:hypothetical protein